MIYHVTGHVSLNFDEYVEAESYERAEEILDSRVNNFQLSKIEITNYGIEGFELLSVMEG